MHKHQNYWVKYVNGCTDEAAAMVEPIKGTITRIQK